MSDSKLWEEAYRAYWKQERAPLAKHAWAQKVGKIAGTKPPERFVKRKKPKPKKAQVSKDHWVETQREYLRWRKTEDFAKWRHKQFLKQGGTCYFCGQPKPVREEL